MLSDGSAHSAIEGGIVNRWTILAWYMTVATSGVAQQPNTPSPSLQELETRARQDSLDPEAHFRLATRYYQQKLARPVQARETLARFVAMAPASRYERELADARQRLGALQQ
jgi:hypothetical protein